MAKVGGVQGFIERRAEGPAFALAAFCMIARASSFYSGGAIALAHILGPRGLALFNGATGVGLAVGAELLGSIAGRQWQVNASEARDAGTRRGMTRHEREALAAHFASRARLSLVFMCVGLGASVAAGFSFLWGASGAGAHTFAGALGELVVTLLLVSIVAYLGIFKESRGDDPGELASVQAYAIRADIVREAGRRIASGKYAPQDVRIVARSLPRAERERFEAALTRESTDDPLWTVRDIAAWLGCDTPAGRRQITRKLARLMERGAGVLRDDASGQYRVPRSVAALHFAEDYVSINRAGERRTPSARGLARAESIASQDRAANALAAGASSDTTGPRQGADSPATMSALALASAPAVLVAGSSAPYTPHLLAGAPR